MGCCHCRVPRICLLLASVVAGLALLVAPARATGNDYPWQWSDPNQLSELSFNYRNCTDFVAWRLNRQSGVTSAPWRFTWSNLAGPGGNGHAIGWKDGAASRGYRVDGTPQIGSVAWWGASRGGGLGHVAIVSAVNLDGSVNIEQYNASPFNYGIENNVHAEAYLHIADTSSVALRIGVLWNGMLDVKEGSVGGSWTTVSGGTSFKLSPSRIAIYNGQELAVKEGSLNATWTIVAGAVDEYELTDNRIGVRVGRQIFVKEGGVGAVWVHVGDGQSFDMSSRRIAVYDNGQLAVKDGSLGAAWTTVTGVVDDFKVTDNRIGIRVGSVVAIKEGPVNAVWLHVANGGDFDLSSNRVAVYDGQVHIKEGSLNSAWTTVAGSVDEFVVTDQLVGVRIGTTVSVKGGPVTAVWTTVGSGQTFGLA